MDNNKEMIEGLVSQILDDYHDDKIINQQALFSQPDKEAVCDLLSKLIKIMYPGFQGHELQILQPGQPDCCSFGGYYVQSAQAGGACLAAES